MTALALVGLALLAGFLALVIGAIYAVVVAREGSFSRITSLPGRAWTDLGILVLIALTSMGVCILVGTTAAVLGRSLAFGIGAALALFPVDNFATIAMTALNALTRWHFWLDATTYLLGPNLNVLPVVSQTDHAAHTAYSTPLVRVDATHAWLVVAAWGTALAVTALVLSRRRDVLQ